MEAVRRPEVEVSPKAQRRRFNAEYKLRILKEADACTKPGELGALLRREGIYSSSLATWRRARERGELKALTPRKRGPKPKTVDPQDRKVRELERKVAFLEAKLEQAELIIDVQKKVSQMLGIQLPKIDEDE